jgi:hypothetical protein
MHLAGGESASGLLVLVSMPTNPVTNHQKRRGLGINRASAAADARLCHQHDHLGCIPGR